MVLLHKAKLRGTPESVSVKDALGKLVIICLGTTGVGLLLNVGVIIGIFQVAMKPPPTLVQLSDGESIGVVPIKSHERTDEAILSFLNNIFTLVFTWSGTIPSATNPGQIIPDKGVDITGTNGQIIGKVPTTVWSASSSMELNFRQEFLRQMAELIPQSVFNQKSTVAFVPVSFSPPVPVSQGRWKVRLISNLLFMKGLKTEEVVPYNVEIYVRSVVTPNAQLVSDLTEHQTQSIPLAKWLAKYRQAGLEIDSIVPYRREDLK